MATDTVIRVTGYTQVVKGLRDVDKATRKEVRDDLRHAGDAVKQGAAARFASIDAKTAAGYRTYVRQRGVSVEQSLRKTTGKHPQFGTLQMVRALIPSLDANEEKTAAAVEESLDRIAAVFNAL